MVTGGLAHLASYQASPPPPYNPDFNPIGRIRQYLKGHGMAGYLSNKGEDLRERIFQEVNRCSTIIRGQWLFPDNHQP
jgi:transposase